MSYQLVFESSAEEDYREAYKWYEGQGERLGLDFEEKVEQCLLKISGSPEAYSLTGKRYRQANVTSFPYLIIYSIEKKAKRIVIYSIFHTSRKPKKKYRKL